MRHLVVSRRSIVHIVHSLADDAVTLCGKWSLDLVLIGAVGIGERMCRHCERIEASQQLAKETA